MRNENVKPIEQHLPQGEMQGCVLVVSDYRLLNLVHAAALCKSGYVVYTAVTCTDVPRIYESYPVDEIDLIASASLVHGWHHQEAEERPHELSAQTDPEWQTRNVLQVVELVSGRQATPPRVIIATDLVDYDCYSISRSALADGGIEIHTYSASNPPSIIGFLD